MYLLNILYIFNLKNKTVTYFTRKIGLIEKRRELQFGTHKLWQNHSQVPQTKERNLTSWEDGLSWEGLFWRKVLRRKVRIQGDDGFSLAKVQSSQFFVGDTTCLSLLLGACNWWFLAVEYSSVEAYNWYRVVWLPSRLLTPLQWGFLSLILTVYIHISWPIYIYIYMIHITCVYMSIDTYILHCKEIYIEIDIIYISIDKNILKLLPAFKI